EAIEQARVDVVPKIVVGGAGGGSGQGGGGGLLDALLAMVLSDRLGEGAASPGGRAPELEQLRAGIRESVLSNLRGGGGAGASGSEPDKG
ncbi:MAG TPA: hypothetical protein VKU41_27040, partial [Polyangiaceae bacterium]|nr:hypothetical protein [Polyangiaceae bacterium]